MKNFDTRVPDISKLFKLPSYDMVKSLRAHRQPVEMVLLKDEPEWLAGFLNENLISAYAYDYGIHNLHQVSVIFTNFQQNLRELVENLMKGLPSSIHDLPAFLSSSMLGFLVDSFEQVCTECFDLNDVNNPDSRELCRVQDLS